MRQLGNVLLGGIDYCQTLLQLAQSFGGFLARFHQVFAHPARDFGQALVEHFCDVALLRLKTLGSARLGRNLAFGHLGQPACHARLTIDQAVHGVRENAQPVIILA